MDSLTDDVYLSVCLFLDPNDLVVTSTVCKQWLPLIALAWQNLNRNERVRYLTFKKRNDISISKLCFLSWSTKHCRRSDGLLLVGGSFGTRSIRQCFMLKDQMPELQEQELSGISSLPLPLGSSAGCIDSFGRPLILGGWDDANERVIKDVFALKLDSGWQELAPLRTKLCYSAACTTSAGDIIICGGGNSPYREATVYSEVLVNRTHKSCIFSDSTKAEVNSEDGDGDDHAIDDDDDDDGNWSDIDGNDEDPQASSEDHWIKLPSLLSRRCGHAAVTLFDDNVVVMGGYAGGVKYLSSAELFDWGSMSWYTLPEMNVPRSGIAAALGPCGSVYVAGGSPDGTIGHKSFERIDVREKQWQQLPSMKHGRGYTAGCMGRLGAFYVSGGLHRGTFAASVEFFDTRAGRWATMEMPSISNSSGGGGAGSAGGAGVKSSSATSSSVNSSPFFSVSGSGIGTAGTSQPAGAGVSSRISSAALAATDVAAAAAAAGLDPSTAAYVPSYYTAPAGSSSGQMSRTAGIQKGLRRACHQMFFVLPS